MRCFYCYENLVSSSNLSVPDTIKILDWIYRIDNNPEMLEIFGGEPLLNWDSVNAILDYHHNPNTKLTTITNGVLLNKEKINVFKRHNILVGISYDGRSAHDIYRITKNNEGTEKIVMNNILESIRENLNISICMTFHNANEKYIFRDIEELHQLGVKKFRIFTVHNNRFRVSIEQRHKIYTRMMEYAESYSLSINLNMDYSESNEYHYYYFDNRVKVQQPGVLGHWDVVGWE